MNGLKIQNNTPLFPLTTTSLSKMEWVDAMIDLVKLIWNAIFPSKVSFHPPIPQNPQVANKEIDPKLKKLHREITVKLHREANYRRIPFDEYNKLGSGAFSNVYKGQEDSSKQRPLALKVLDLKEITHLNEKNEVSYLNSSRLGNDEGEGATLSLPPKSHLARSYGVFVWDPKQREVHFVTKENAHQFKDCIVIATVSKLQTGDLRNEMQQGQMRLERIKKVTFQVLTALQTLHNQERLHLDIKPSNILITKKGNAKLADFGNSTNKKSKYPTPGGTRPYAAPEIFGDNPKLSKAADLYSFGAMLHEMVTDDMIDSDPNLQKLIPIGGGLLSRKPDERPEIKAVISNPFFF